MCISTCITVYKYHSIYKKNTWIVSLNKILFEVKFSVKNSSETFGRLDAVASRAQGVPIAMCGDQQMDDEGRYWISCWYWM